VQRLISSIHPAGQPLVRRVCLLLALITIVLYLPVQNFPFNSYDDPQYLTQNPHVQNGLTVTAIAWAFTTGYADNWHPLTWLSHLLDVELFGFHAGGHHLTNLLFHVANTLLLFLVLNCWTGTLWRSAFVAALFAWHPIHVESVAWVAERKDVLSTCFWLLTMIAYGKYSGSSRESGLAEPPRPLAGRRFYMLALLFFVLGLLCKPMLVSLPLILLLLDYWPLHRIQLPFTCKDVLPLLLEKIPFFLLAAASCVVTYLVQKNGGAVQPLDNLSLADRFANAIVSYARYLGKIFWPTDLAIIYPYSRHLPLIEVVSAAFLLLAVGGVVARLAKTHPPLVVGWLWFLITLVPVIGLVQVGDQALADRYAYIPSIGLFLLLAWEVPRLFSPAVAGVPLVSSAAIILVACLVATTHQLRYWQNNIALFTHAIEVTKDNSVAESSLGLAFDAQGQTNEAILHEQRAIQINPNYPLAQNDLGLILLHEGCLDEAITRFHAAIAMNPRYDNAMVNLGVTLAQQGRQEDAIAQYRQALAIAPDNPYAHNALGRALELGNRLDEAAAQYSAAIACKPDFAVAHENLGVVLALSGRYQESEFQFAQALQLQPDSASIHFNLGNALMRQNKLRDAATHYLMAVRFQPGYLEAHYNLALVLDQLGQTADAIQHYRIVLSLDPHYPLAPQIQKRLRLAQPVPK